MLEITIPETELFDDTTQRFIKIPATLIMLEHSLVSVSKWESFYEKPFLGRNEKSLDETRQYIKYMTVSPWPPHETYLALSRENYQQISNYIDAKMTATIFNELPNSPKNTGEFITAEIIYYWMIALQIPIECQYWHLARLLALVKVLNIKNAPTKKMGRRETLSRQRSLNEERLARMNTTG